jgi:iron complex outermembrane receptor protein
MANSAIHYKQRLMLFAACGLVASLVPAGSAMAQSAQPPVQLAQVGTTAVTPGSGSTESITVRAAKRLLKEKNSPSAVTELGEKAIAATGVSGSVASILRQAPSVNLYQQGIGDNAPVLTIRGLRGLEVATTLDGVPIQDLEAPGASYNSNNIGSYISLDQISGVSIYPGVAYPNRNTFGTIGGTVAYDSLRPSDDKYIDLIGEIGAFETYKEGFIINTGSLDGPAGSGDNAPKLLMQYANLQTAGFIDYTPARYNNVEVAFDKPYDDGQSKFQATVLYNTGKGLFQNEPVPVPYLQKNGTFSNYDPSVWQDFEKNDYLTLILKDDTYISDLIPDVGLSVFYLQNDSQATTYAGINDLAPSGDSTPVSLGSGANTVVPFINNPAGFGYGYGYPTTNPNGVTGAYYGTVGPNNFLYNPGYPYAPDQLYPIGSAQCPASVAAKYTAKDLAIPCGLNSELAIGHNYTYGIQPRATIDPPDIFGIDQSIQVGGIVAKETSPSTKLYFGATPQVAQTASNLSNIFGGGFDGGTERTIFQGYAQDKINLLNNTLHVTPGATLEGTYSSYDQSDVFGPPGYESFKNTKWDREFLPFFNITYDFDQVAPILKGTSIYGSIANSALFAPVTDFSPSAQAAPPYASIVHLYEGGITYNTSIVSAHADYFYQKVDRDFGFFQNQSGPDVGLEDYTNFGQREFKGFEAAVTWQITPDLQLFGNASYTRARYLTNSFAFTTVAEDQYGIAIKGAPVTGVPDWLSTFGLDWSRKNALEDGDGFNVRVTEQYTGHQSTTYDINYSTGFSQISNFPGLGPVGPCTPVGTPGNYTGYTGSGCLRFSQLSGDTVYDPHGGISPYFLTNLDINYTLPTPYLPVLKRLKFDLNIQNLFNKLYYQYFYKQVSPGACSITASNPTGSNYGCTVNFADGIPGQPFSVFATITARF